MYILSKLWLVGIGLLGLGFGSLAGIKLLAIPPTPDSTVTPTSGSTVASLRSNPPAPGKTVEVEAYFNGMMSRRHSIPPTVYERARCPLFVYEAALTDQPVPGQLSILNSVRNNVLPDKAPWLIAGVLKPNKAGVVIEPSLPYHARLRGHLGDPAVAKCPRADRIFIVEQVVKVYSQQPPERSFFQMNRPSNLASWPRVRNAKLNYSIAYPPGWKVERESKPNGSSDLVLRFPQLPNYPVVVRVYPNTRRYSHYLSRPQPSTITGDIRQTWIMGGKGSQHLSGFTVEQDAGEGSRTQSVLFSTRDRIYELKLQYPLGFKASQPLLTNYSAIVLGFRLDNPKQNIPFSPYPTPTPTASPREPKRK